jgi:hypothetical protein
MKRIGQFPCVGGMNATNACYQAVAWTDVYGVFHQGAPMDAVQPWQYADRYYDYEIGRGQTANTRMVLMVKDNQLRTYFTPPQAPERRVAAFAYDLSQFGYSGGKIGLYMYAHQAQFFDMRIGELSGGNAVTSFCANGGTCSSKSGLCE